MITENQICVLKAQQFRIASASTTLANPRMFIILFFHKEFPTLVRVRVVLKKSQGQCPVVPEFSVETINRTYEVVEAAKRPFEYKAMAFIRKYHLRETMLDG